MQFDRRKTRLAELGRIVTGKTPPSAVEGCFGGGTPFVTPSDYDGSKYIRRTARTLTTRGQQTISGVRLPSNAVMVTCIGSDMGKVALSAVEVFTNQQINSLIVESGDSPEYVYYNLLMRKSELRTKASGSAQPILNKSAFGATEIELPGPDAQAAIVEILRALDDRIDLLRQTNVTLESIAQALFKSWFIDFDPVRAKAEGREPEGMDAATAELFPAEFEESEIGLIPKGWTVASLAERCEVQIGGVWGEESQSAKASIEVCCLRGIDAVDLAKGELPVPPVRWVTQKQIESRRLHAGDILVEGSGSFCGRSLLWADSYEKLVPLTATYSNFVKRLSAPAGPHYSRWLQRHLDSVYQSGEVKNYRTGSAFPNLDLTGMLGVTRILPSEELLMQYDALMRSFECQKVARIRHAITLRDLRDALLPRLISGKLRLPEAQAQLEDALA